LSPVNLEKPFDSKTSLVIADSDFVMCQFLLHYEYWKNKETSNADLWASMLQIRRSAIAEFVEFLPNFLRSDLARSIYNEFRNCDWCDYITWKQVGKYINANT
jgi:wobble nucleotide-excising tRNase